MKKSTKYKFYLDGIERTANELYKLFDYNKPQFYRIFKNQYDFETQGLQQIKYKITTRKAYDVFKDFEVIITAEVK